MDEKFKIIIMIKKLIDDYDNLFFSSKEELNKLKLEINNKTKIYKNNQNINYLGRKKKGKKSRSYMVNRKLKQRYYQYYNDEIKLNSLISSINSINNNKVYKGGK